VSLELREVSIERKDRDSQVQNHTKMTMWWMQGALLLKQLQLTVCR
jgi:hypothetical protein